MHLDLSSGNRTDVELILIYVGYKLGGFGQQRDVLFCVFEFVGM